jgi:hypothetical protein
MLAAFALPAWGDGGAHPVDIQVFGDLDRTVLQYSFGEPAVQIVNIGGTPYQKLRLTGEPLAMEAGAPSLPRICRSIIIPDDAEMAVSVISSSYYEISGIDIVPSKGSILRTVDPAEVPYTFGHAYSNDRFWPGALAELREPYIMRDHRGIVVMVHPFQYNPVQQLLRVYTDIEIEVRAVGTGEVNVLTRRRPAKTLSLAFHELYQHHFLNYPGTRYEPLDEDGDMLIICHDPWLDLIQPLADHKSAIGINTAVVGVSEIGNNQHAIKDYVQELYDTSDLAFVLLVGDAAQVAPFYDPGSGGAATDPAYSLLAGGDTYPDIMVGRFSAESEAQLTTQVQRTIDYEMMPAALQEWFWRGTGVASNQGPGDDNEMDDEHIDNIRLQLLEYGYTEVDQIYDPTATAQQVTDALNAGRGIINYCGHGWYGGWSSSDFSSEHVNALVNINMLPFITSVACNTGEFDSYTCFGEAWLRATESGQPTGGIGFYGSTIGQYWDEPMEAQDEFNILLTTEAYRCYGTLCYAGSCSMMDDYGATGVDMFMTWHVFGDPSVQVVGVPPTAGGLVVTPFAGLNAAGPNGGPFEPDSVTYTLINYNDDPIEYAVAVNANWVDLSSEGGTIPPSGEVLVEVSIDQGVASHFGNGQYEATVEFTNVTTHEGDTDRTVRLEVGVPEPIHMFDLASDPGWSMTGEWAFGEPTGQGGQTYGYPDPTSGATGAYVCGVNLNGDYSRTVGGPYFLTTSAIDCEQLIHTQLHFQRWLNTDYPPYVYATIEVSNNGLEWEDVWVNPGSEVAENSWNEVSYDISAVADRSATVFVRWGYQVGQAAYAYSGWNIDDIAIWGTPIETADLAQEDLSIPVWFELSSVSPNPVRTSTQITYAVAARDRIRLEIYDVIGRKLATLLDRLVEPGFYTSVWNGTDDRGVSVAQGVYFARLRSSAYKCGRTILVLR